MVLVDWPLLSLARVAPFALLQTVFAIGTGILFLHEKVSVRLVAGASICIGGVLLTQVGANGDKATAPRSSLFNQVSMSEITGGLI